MSRIRALRDLPPELQHAAADVIAGTALPAQLCAVCGGGRTRERTLRMWADGAFLRLHCWRASCSYSAQCLLEPGTVIAPPKFQPRFFEGEFGPQDDAAERLWLSYGISPTATVDYGVQSIVDRAAVYMPVLGPDGTERGGMVRYFDGTKPKTVAYKHTDLPFQAWHVRTCPCCPPEERAAGVIVEDQLSAMRLWQLGYTAVALLGTNLNGDKAAELQRYTPHWRLALDADAFSKAVGYAKKWPWLQPVRLELDFKDCTDEQIMERLA